MKIIASAPTRISLFGGGTDMPSFYKEHGGMVISFAINLRQHFTFHYGNEVIKPSEMKDEFPYGANKEFIYQMFTDAKIGGGVFNIKSTCEARLRSGLGTSAAAAVATLCAIDRIKEKTETKLEELVKRAYKAEETMGWYGGMQDYYASALGGTNIIYFEKNAPNRIVGVQRPIAEDFAQGMVLVWTGERVEKNKHHIQDLFKTSTAKRTQALLDMKEMTQNALSLLLKKDFIKIGKQLDIYWKMKKKSNPLVTTEKIDKIYEQAMEAGAFGGKLLGAGRGGYMLFLVEPVDRKLFVERMKRQGIEEVDFMLDFQGVETRIL